MSSGNNTNNGSNGNGANKIYWQRIALPNLVEQVDDSLEVQIAKFNKQSCCQRDKLMKQVAEQEAQRKAEEERRKAKEEAKRAAKEEVRKLAEEEAKKKAEEDTQKRAEFQAWWQANLERKARKKAEAKAAMEVMRALIVQKAVQGEKPKPKVHGMELFSSCLFTNLIFRFFSNVRQPVSTRLTRKSRGGTPHATGAGRVATARCVPCPTTYARQCAIGARR